MLRYSEGITEKDYSELRASVGWQKIDSAQAQSGLDHSDYIISCKDGDDPVGCARVFWDKGYIAYLADVMVKPEYQGQGIGRRLVTDCISFVDRQLRDGWRIKIVIVSAKGREGFYESLGFRIRPNEGYGAGMDLWREPGTGF